MLLVSVLIPVYNHEKYIIECLDSVRDSDYKNIELIIIDDGSKDRSASLVQSWLDANRHCFVRTQFHQQANSGLCKTVNRLIGFARGDIVVPFASDDVLLPLGISLRVSYLQNTPGVLAVFADAAMIDMNGNVLCREMEKNFYKINKKALEDPEFIASELILRWGVPGPVFVAWKKAYDPIIGIGLYNETLMAEDRDFYLRLLSRKALGYISDEVALYRYVPDSACHSKEKDCLIQQSIIQSEKEALDNFYGKEKYFLTLVCLNTEMFFRSSYHQRFKFVWFLLAISTGITVKIVYQIHKWLFGISHLNGKRS